jgi:hypothetical protein
MKSEFYFKCSVYDIENISLPYLLSRVGNVTRLRAGRSWVQIPVEVRNIGVHPISYSMVTPIDGKVKECSHTSNRPICIYGVERDNFKFLRFAISLLPIIATGMQ